MADLDELDALHAAATAGEGGVRSYQEPSGEFNPAPSWEVYDEDNLVLTAALHNAWPTVSAQLRAAEAEVERLRGALRAMVDTYPTAALVTPSRFSSAVDAARAALGKP